MRSVPALLLVVALTTTRAIPAYAQGTPTVTPAARHHVISASPLLWVFKWYNADYEQTMTATTTLGVSGSYVSFDNDDYGRASVMLRYYPQGTALTGFSLGAQTGVFRRTNDVCTPSTPP